MSTDDPDKYKTLADVAKRAQANQPDEIRLLAAPEHRWANATAVEAHANAFKSVGFTEAGTYTVDVLPLALRFLIKESERMYSIIYEHPKAGVWINVVVLYE